MKPFNLEQALAGEPVKLGNGLKAYIKYVMPEEYVGDYPLRGFYLTNDVDTGVDTLMWKMGSNNPLAPSPQYNIIGMWEEPRPRVQLNLPCPLKAPQEGMWYISSDNQKACKSGYCKGQNSSFNEDDLDAGRYFASEEDAKEWINAMKEARR